MPELPEVEASRRRLETALRGRRIVAVDAVRDPVVFPGLTPARLRRALVGARVREVRRHGKHLWLELDRRPWLTLHFGMTGWVHFPGDDALMPRFARLTLTSDRGQRVVYTDSRRFGRIRLQHDPPSETPLRRLGPDPLADCPPVARLREQLRRRSAPVKAVLLDQALFAGVGNWVADEVLFQAGIDPRRPASSLEPRELSALRKALIHVLRTAVKLDADSLRFPSTWLFHHRWGRRKDASTDRGDAITHTTIGGRTTAWVPGRQR